MTKLIQELKNSIKLVYGIKAIYHPYLITLEVNEKLFDYYNSIYNNKFNQVERALKNCDYNKYIYLHERPFRLQAYLKIVHLLSDDQRYGFLRDIWIDSEEPFVNLDVWCVLFRDANKFKKQLMRKIDFDFYLKLPEKVTIFRGQRPDKLDGISFTLDKLKAIWFAKRFNKDGNVIELQVYKKDIIAYFNDRDEQEIIYIGDIN